MEYCIANYDESMWLWTIVKIEGKNVSSFGLFGEPEQAEDFILRFCSEENNG